MDLNMNMNMDMNKNARMVSKRTYPSMSLHLQAFYALDDGGARIVYAIEQCLYDKISMFTLRLPTNKEPTFNCIILMTTSPPREHQ